MNNAEFLALASFSTSRTLTLGSATGATIGVAGGANLTLNTGLAWGAAADTLTKVENGTLTLTGSASGGPTGATTINAGAIAITAANQLPAGITVANSVGAALQISGGATFNQALSLQSFGIQGRGSLENTSGANTWSGVPTISNDAAIGNDDTANALTISGAINTNGKNLFFVGPGSININTAMTGAGNVLQLGSGAGTLNATGTTYGTLNVDNGTLILAGSATAGTGTENVNYGGTMTVTDVTTNTNNRLVLHSMNMVGGATFNFNGSSAAADRPRGSTV